MAISDLPQAISVRPSDAVKVEFDRDEPTRLGGVE
jgi:hypothetical protein